MPESFTKGQQIAPVIRGLKAYPTSTIVAAVADRIENRGIAPERILVLTFSRKAAAELRERITARLKRTTREPLAVTFHSYAYALARREFVLAGDEPPRLLSAPEQLLEIRRMLKGEASDGGSRWPERLRPALATRGFAEEVRDLLLRAAERGLDGRSLRQLGKHKDRDDWAAAVDYWRTLVTDDDALIALDPTHYYGHAQMLDGLMAALAAAAVGAAVKVALMPPTRVVRLTEALVRPVALMSPTSALAVTLPASPVSRTDPAPAVTRTAAERGTASV